MRLPVGAVKVSVALLAVVGGVAVSGEPAVAAIPPGAPTVTASFPGLHGVGITWSGDFSGAIPTSYSVYSRPNAGSSYALLATVGASATNQHGSYIDGSIANGSSAQYAVTETNGNGSSAKSDPFSASRPALDPIAGSNNALTVDALPNSGLTSEHFDPATNGTVTLGGDRLTGKSGTTSTTVDLPLVPSAGSYAVGDTSAAGPIDLNLKTEDQSCTTETGTIDVIDAAYDATLDPVVFSASYAISCDGKPTTYGDIRYKSTQPYRDVVVMPSAVAGDSSVGQNQTFPVTIANFGTETAHIGGLAITGPGAADWSAQGNGCLNLTLDAKGSCTVYLEFNPTDSGHETAIATISDNSVRGQHVINLDGSGVVPPSSPPTVARVGIHRVAITWTPPTDNGGGPITAYLVYRTIPGHTQTLASTVTPHDPDTGGSYLEANVPTGVTYQYSVVARNVAGDSVSSDVSATTPHDEILLDATTAISTSGDEPVAVATPAITGRVAVVPGSNRIVYPAQYTGSVDLAVASPYATVGPMRLTTIGATDPAVSADGTTVAFTHVDGSGTLSIYTIPLKGGTPTKVATGVTNPSWLADDQTLIAERSAHEGTPASGDALVTIARNGTIATIPGTTDGHQPAVSPDGTQIAYQLDNQGASTYSLAVIPVAGGVAATSNATAHSIDDISWRTDGAVLFAAVDGSVQQAAYSVASGPGPLTTLSPSDVTGVRWPAYINSDAVSLLNPTPITGARPSVDIGAAAGATTTCRIDGATSTPCVSDWTSIVALSAGRHVLVVTSTPSTGVASTVSWGFTVDTTKPAVSLDPPSMTTTGKHAVFRFVGRDANGIASYDVRIRSGRVHHNLRKWTYPAKFQATTRTSAKVRVKTGHRYCVSVRSRDLAKNVSKWSRPGCTRGV